MYIQSFIFNSIFQQPRNDKKIQKSMFWVLEDTSVLTKPVPYMRNILKNCYSPTPYNPTHWQQITKKPSHHALCLTGLLMKRKWASLNLREKKQIICFLNPCSWQLFGLLLAPSLSLLLYAFVVQFKFHSSMHPWRHLLLHFWFKWVYRFGPYTSGSFRLTF